MRSQVEQVLLLYRQIGEKVDTFSQDNKHISEYQKFWQGIKEHNTEQIKAISRFMVLKCNR
jgi:hypothetical protein